MGSIDSVLRAHVLFVAFLVNVTWPSRALSRHLLTWFLILCMAKVERITVHAFSCSASRLFLVYFCVCIDCYFCVHLDALPFDTNSLRSFVCIRMHSHATYNYSHDGV